MPIQVTGRAERWVPVTVLPTDQAILNRIKTWITFLRSGKYKQGKGRLAYKADVTNEKELNYCCLGVACEVAIAEFPNKFHWSQDESSTGLVFMDKQNIHAAGVEVNFNEELKHLFGSAESGGLMYRCVDMDYTQPQSLSGANIGYNMSLIGLNDAFANPYTFEQIAELLEKTLDYKEVETT